LGRGGGKRAGGKEGSVINSVSENEEVQSSNRVREKIQIIERDDKGYQRVGTKGKLSKGDREEPLKGEDGKTLRV